MPGRDVGQLRRDRTLAAIQGLKACFSDPRHALAMAAMQACKVGDRIAGRRLTISDARVGYRLSGFRPRLVPVLRRASANGWPRRVCGSSPPWSCPQPRTTDFVVCGDLLSVCPVMANLASCVPWFRGQWLDVTCNVPQERANLTSDRNNSDGRLLTFRRHAAVAGAQAGLRLPRNVTDDLRQFCQSFFMAFTNSCGMPVSPSRGHALTGTRPPPAPSSIAEQSRPAPHQDERSARRSSAPR
jgi:hypothetical protein